MPQSDASLSCFSVPQGLFQPARFISSLLFCSAGIISTDRIHLYLALFFHRDYFHRPVSSLSRSFLPQGLFQPVSFISSLLFCSTGIISTGQFHPWLALLFHRDYFHRPDSSLSCSFVPQGLFPPPGFISSLLFVPQELFPPPGFIPILLFSSAGIISTARIHPYLALLLRRDYFHRPDSSLSCSFVPQGLFPPARFIPSSLVCSTGIISTGQIHPWLALFHRRDYFHRPVSSLARSFVPQGLFQSASFISSSLFCSAGIISTGQIHL